MAQEHWYHILLDFVHNGNVIENKHIASFLTEDDAIDFAVDTREYYKALGDECRIRILYDGKNIKSYAFRKLNGRA